MSKADLLNELSIDRTENSAPNGRSTWPYVLGLVLFAAAAAYWWWSRGSSDLQVTVATAQRLTDPSRAVNDAILDGSGYVTARRQATVSSKTTGKVLEVLIEEGMRVEADQVLARLDDSLPSAQLDLAEAQLSASREALNEIRVDLADAERTLRRSRELVGRKLVSQEELDSARARVDALKARISARQKDVEVSQKNVALRARELDDMTIRAPFAGMVIAKSAQPGEMISPVSAGGGFTRTGIGTLVDMDSLEIEVDVNEAYIDRVRAGQKVIARLDAYPDWQIDAEVIAIIPAADRQKATVPVRIGFLERDARILPDMGIQVSFQADRSTDQAETAPTLTGVTVPKTAVRELDGRTLVFKVTDGLASRQAVTAGGSVGSRIVVVAGLQPGDRVINPLPDTLTDGQAVVITDTPG